MKIVQRRNTTKLFLETRRGGGDAHGNVSTLCVFGVCVCLGRLGSGQDSVWLNVRPSDRLTFCLCWVC